MLQRRCCNLSQKGLSVSNIFYFPDIKLKLPPKGPKRNTALLVLSFGIVVVAAITTFASNSTSPSNIPPSPKAIPLGGVDLAQYCKSLDYDTNDGENNEEFCSSNINLDEACNWQHERDDLRLTFNRDNDPESGICYDSQEDQIGGISDMLGYCKFENNSPDVKAEVVNGDWTCRTKIDMGLVCSWQYEKRAVEARYEEGTWQCYERE